MEKIGIAIVFIAQIKCMLSEMTQITDNKVSLL
jgi:hypothetical protein